MGLNFESLYPGYIPKRFYEGVRFGIFSLYIWFSFSHDGKKFNPARQILKDLRITVPWVCWERFRFLIVKPSSVSTNVFFSEPNLLILGYSNRRFWVTLTIFFSGETNSAPWSMVDRIFWKRVDKQANLYFYVKFRGQYGNCSSNEKDHVKNLQSRNVRWNNQKKADYYDIRCFQY